MLGDHGLLAKKVFYEGAVNVPCLFRPPNGQSQTSTTALTCHLDIVATLLDISKANPLQDSDGRSLMPILGGESKTAQRTAVVSELGLPPSAFVMLRTEDHKISVDAKSREPIELYDLSEDPNELNNLVAAEDYIHVRERLVSEMLNPMLSSLDTSAW